MPQARDADADVAAAAPPMAPDDVEVDLTKLDSSSARDAASLSALAALERLQQQPPESPSDADAAAPSAAEACLGNDVDDCQPSDYLLQLPAEVAVMLLERLPLATIARVRCTSLVLNAWGRRAAACVTSIDGSALSRVLSEGGTTAAPGLAWLLQDCECKPLVAMLGGEATADALAMLLGSASSTLLTLELRNCDKLSVAWLPTLVSEADAAVLEVSAAACGCPAAIDVPAPAPSLDPSPMRSLSIVRCRLIADSASLELAQWIGRMHALTHLSLEGHTALDDRSLCEIVAGCPLLRSVCLNSCRALTDVAVLGSLRDLHTLDIGSCPSIPTFRSVAQGCAQLTSLNVSLCKLFGDSACTACAEHMPQLERLNITGTPVTNDGLAAVAMSCPKLSWLNCTRCLGVDDDGAVIIAVRCPLLRHLFLARCGITDHALICFGQFLGDLLEIHLAGCSGISDLGLKHFAEGCPHLATLSIDTCAGISDEGSRALAGSCAKLETFQANGCCGLGDDSLIALSHGCKALSRIDVRGCARVTENGIAACARRLPRCKVFANTQAVQLA